jgi:hypothetical protein
MYRMFPSPFLLPLFFFLAFFLIVIVLSIIINADPIVYALSTVWTLKSCLEGYYLDVTFKFLSAVQSNQFLHRTQSETRVPAPSSPDSC